MSLILYDTDFKILDGEGPIEINLNNRPKTLLGRGSQSMPVDIVLFARKNGSEIISRKHAEIVQVCMDNASSNKIADSKKKVHKDSNVISYFSIRDLGALNGTFVNRKRIAYQELYDGDLIQLGNVYPVT